MMRGVQAAWPHIGALLAIGAVFAGAAVAHDGSAGLWAGGTAVEKRETI